MSYHTQHKLTPAPHGNRPQPGRHLPAADHSSHAPTNSRTAHAGRGDGDNGYHGAMVGASSSRHDQALDPRRDALKHFCGPAPHAAPHSVATYLRAPLLSSSSGEVALSRPVGFPMVWGELALAFYIIKDLLAIALFSAQPTGSMGWAGTTKYLV